MAVKAKASAADWGKMLMDPDVWAMTPGLGATSIVKMPFAGRAAWMVLRGGAKGAKPGPEIFRIGRRLTERGGRRLTDAFVGQGGELGEQAGRDIVAGSIKSGRQAYPRGDPRRPVWRRAKGAPEAAAEPFERAVSLPPPGVRAEGSDAIWKFYQQANKVQQWIGEKVRARQFPLPRGQG